MRQLQGQRVEYPPRIFTSTVLAKMQRKKVARKELAAFLGITPLTMARIEKGCDLKLSYAIKLARLFKCPVEELWIAPRS